MAPKKGPKVAAPSRRNRQLPILSMLTESPVRNSLSPVRPLTATSVLKPPVASADRLQRPRGPGSLKHDGVAAAKIDVKGKGKEELQEGDLLWCDYYEPRQKIDLAIHKKKIEQVEGWLRESLSAGPIRKYRRILVLSGPAGSGKSTLMKVLSAADQLNFDLVEWRNDDAHWAYTSDSTWEQGKSGTQATDVAADENEASRSNKLRMFLSSASQYPTLAMQSTEEGPVQNYAQPGTSATRAERDSSSARRVIVLEDLPNLNHAPTKASFIAALESFLLHQHSDRNTPLVLIISESIPRLDDWDAESSGRDFRERNEATMTVRRLIPEATRSNVGFMHVEFNAVAPTILTKALKRVLELARPLHSSTVPAPTSAAAKELVQAVVDSAAGDLRSAVNTLQVVLLHATSPSTSSRGVKRFANGKGVLANTKPEKIGKKTIATLSGKESSLVLFHTLGKILYNKRRGDPDVERSDESSEDDSKGIAKHTLTIHEIIDLPLHMQHLHRRPSKVDPEYLWRTMPVDSGTLQVYLHQNYPPFCEEIEQCSALCDNISQAESLRPAHEEWYHTPLTDYYAFLITIHGSLLSLPSPVPRNQVRKMQGAALFPKIKQLRENVEALSEIHTALKEDALEQDDSTHTLSTLSDATSRALVCEILPLLSKSHPDLVSNSLKELVHLPWIVSASSMTSSQQQEDEEEGVGDVECHIDVDILAGSQAPLAEGAILMEGSDTANLAGHSVSARGEIISSINLAALTGEKTGKAQQGEDEDEDDDDIIEDFD